MLFPAEDYADRQAGLRDIIELHGLDALLLTSPAAVAHATGHLGWLPAACLVTADACTLIRAAGDLSGEGLVYDPLVPDALWLAVVGLSGTGKSVGCEADHLTLSMAEKLNGHLRPKRGMDISPATAAQRLVKSEAEVALITEAANLAMDGLRAVACGQPTETARAAMLAAIARRFPDAQGPGFAAVLRGEGCMQAGQAGAANGGPVLEAIVVLGGYAVPVELPVAGDEASLPAGLGPGVACSDLVAASGGMAGHSIGLTASAFMREGGLDLVAGNQTLLEPGMVLALYSKIGQQELALVTDEGAIRLIAAVTTA